MFENTNNAFFNCYYNNVPNLILLTENLKIGDSSKFFDKT